MAVVSFFSLNNVFIAYPIFLGKLFFVLLKAINNVSNAKLLW
ncbi:hypothetical protein AS4_43290 [Acinetobacter guillouiae]|nr:hypothetical protein AS4_43290 [Acinetobacter guillouiae]